MAGPQPLSDAALIQYMQRAHQELAPFLDSVTVQVLSSDDEGQAFKAWGSGVLFRAAGRPFVVTAEHVLDGRRLWLRSPLLAAPVALRGSKTVAVKNRDVMVIQPSEDALAATASLRFLTLAEVNLDPAQEVFAITGFPLELNQCVPQQMNAMTYITHRYSGPLAGLGYDGDERQILLEYDLNDSLGIDGTTEGLPRYLHGMSGCPVWAVGDPSSRSLAVAGIQTSTIERPGFLIVKSTRWNVVLALLAAKFPELVPELTVRGFDVQ